MFLTAFRASVFCSGVMISLDTMSIIFPPNFGYSKNNLEWVANQLHHASDWIKCCRCDLWVIKTWNEGEKDRHTIRILDVDAINRAIVARTSFPASGFACGATRCELISIYGSNFNDQHTKKYPLTRDNTLQNPTLAACIAQRQDYHPMIHELWRNDM